MKGCYLYIMPWGQVQIVFAHHKSFQSSSRCPGPLGGGVTSLLGRFTGTFLLTQERGKGYACILGSTLDSSFLTRSIFRACYFQPKHNLSINF